MWLYATETKLSFYKQSACSVELNCHWWWCNVPLDVELQVVIIFLGVRGFLDKVEIKNISKFEAEWVEFLQTNHSSILTEIRQKKELSKELDKQLKTLCEQFTNNFLNK